MAWCAVLRPAWRAALRPSSAAAALLLLYCPPPHTLPQGMNLMPARMLSLCPSEAKSGGQGFAPTKLRCRDPWVSASVVATAR